MEEVKFSFYKKGIIIYTENLYSSLLKRLLNNKCICESCKTKDQYTKKEYNNIIIIYTYIIIYIHIFLYTSNEQSAT